MITKKIEKEIHILEREDVVRLVSEMAGREVSLDELDVCLYVCMPYGVAVKGDFSGCGLYCEIYVDGESIEDDDYNSPLDDFLAGCDFYLTDEEIFAFDTSEFHSFERCADSSD